MPKFFLGVLILLFFGPLGLLLYIAFVVMSTRKE
jgi:hypothetical protein